MTAGESSEFEVHQSKEDLHHRKITAVTIASIVIIAVSLVVAWVLLERGRQGRAPEPTLPKVAPRTISTIEQTLILDTKRGLDLRSDQEAELRRFGWADRDAGIATVPIDQAIDTFVQHPPAVDAAVAPLAPTTTAPPPPARKEPGR